jgi:hypothetical protein
MESDPRLNRVAVSAVTTTDDSRRIERCRGLGRASSVPKPFDYDRSVAAIRRLGLFLLGNGIPKADGEHVSRS